MLPVCVTVPLLPITIFPETVKVFDTARVETLAPVPIVSDLHVDDAVTAGWLAPVKFASPKVPDEEEIKEDIKVNLDVEVTDQTKIEEIVVQAAEPEEETDQVFNIVEESASPKGGMAAFYKFVGDKIKYPPQARRMGIEGRVFVEFVILKDGTLSEVRAIKGIGAGCDEEAVRIVQSSPAWNPGKQRGKPVKQRYTLPIIFKLG